MYSQNVHKTLAEFDVESITEQSVAQVYLIAMYCKQPSGQKPRPVHKLSINSSYGGLTVTGSLLSQIPLEIHVGRFLLASIAYDCLAEGVLVSAFISALSSASGLYKSTHEMSSLSDLERWKLFLGIYSSRVHFDEGFGVPSYQLESL